MPIIKSCFDHYLESKPLPTLVPDERHNWRPISKDVDLVAFVIDIDENDNILMVKVQTYTEPTLNRARRDQASGFYPRDILKLEKIFAQQP